jgi:hypothetical protein
VVAILATALVAAVAAASPPINYCQVIPSANVLRNQWGFHGGYPITGATGSYTKGHGKVNLVTGAVSGVICQVDRPPNMPDRQIVVSPRSLIFASHHAVMFGVPGNMIKMGVRVTSTTDLMCPVGTHGQVTMFASYNGIAKDSIQFSFPATCRDHRHRYTGPSVVANVPPN